MNDENENGNSGFIIVYLFVGFSGFIVGAAFGAFLMRVVMG